MRPPKYITSHLNYRDWWYKKKTRTHTNSTFNLLRSSPLLKTHTLSTIFFSTDRNILVSVLDKLAFVHLLYRLTVKLPARHGHLLRVERGPQSRV